MAEAEVKPDALDELIYDAYKARVLSNVERAEFEAAERGGMARAAMHEAMTEQASNDRVRWKIADSRGETAAQKSAREAAEFRQQRDAWIERYVGPLRSRRRKKAADYETGAQ